MQIDEDFKDIKRRLIEYHADRNHDKISELLDNIESINEFKLIYLRADTDDHDYYKKYRLIQAWSLEELSLKLAILGY